MTTLIQPMIEHEIVPLSSLQEHDEAIIHVTELECDEQQVLISMGLHEDASFRLCQQGQPCIIQVEATRLGLSREVTNRIMVRRCNVCNDA